jgi:hypothetical protein
MSLRAGRGLLLSFSIDIKVVVYPFDSFLLLSYTPKIDKAMIRLIRIAHDIPSLHFVNHYYPAECFK